jgi:hypothetical protein
MWMVAQEPARDNERGACSLQPKSPRAQWIRTRRAAGRNPTARSRIDARRYWGVRPDELRAGRRAQHAQHRVKRSH